MVDQSTHDPKLTGLNPALLTNGECDEKTWMPEITGSESDLFSQEVHLVKQSIHDPKFARLNPAATGTG